MVEGKLGRRAADAGFVVSDAQAMRSALRSRACLKRKWMGRRPASTNSDVVGVVLKVPRIQSYEMKINLTGGED